MAKLLDEPLLVSLLDRSDFDCDQGGLYVFGSSAEQRSAIDEDWQNRQVTRGVDFIEITNQEPDSADYESTSGARGAVQLSSKSQALDLVSEDVNRTLYLDITGLSHHVWGPLVRAGVDSRMPFFIIYMEPKAYKLRKHPQRGAFYDLSDRTDGVRPIPTFAHLRSDRFSNRILVPLLGFEGARFAHVMQLVEPAPGETYPVVGVPGFRAEYPFITYWGNESPLLDDHTWLDIRYAIANDPFDLFHVVRLLAEEHPDALVQIAPIGTKPHGLGAILFNLSQPDRVEIIYDNPIRKGERTSGTARLCVYDVGTFVQSDLFAWSGECALGMLPR